MRRKLSDVEKKITIRNIERMKKEIEHLNYLVEYNTLMVEKGLWFNYLEKVEEFKNMKGRMIEDIKMNYTKINILAEQIEKGVEIREKEIPVGVG